jgi:hypothetical protein
LSSDQDDLKPTGVGGSPEPTSANVGSIKGNNHGQTKIDSEQFRAAAVAKPADDNRSISPQQAAITLTKKQGILSRAKEAVVGHVEGAIQKHQEQQAQALDDWRHYLALRANSKSSTQARNLFVAERGLARFRKLAPYFASESRVKAEIASKEQAAARSAGSPAPSTRQVTKTLQPIFGGRALVKPYIRGMPKSKLVPPGMHVQLAPKGDPAFVSGRRTAAPQGNVKGKKDIFGLGPWRPGVAYTRRRRRPVP